MRGYIVLADVYENITDDDIYSEPCYGDHTYDVQQSIDGRWITYNAPCVCVVVPVGIVNYARPTLAYVPSDDDLPF